MPGHVLIYNGITLDNILTESYQQEVEYSADKVDYLWTKITIQVHCVFNRAVSPANAGEDPTDIMNRVRKQLLTPRQTLQYVSFNGKTLLTSPTAGQSCDAHNGPIPRHCNIVTLNESTWIIDYLIETYIIECYSGTQDIPYLSNRWKTTVDIDQSGYAKRTINGTVRFRTNTADNPDQYRNIFVPDLLNGFVRKTINVVLHSDNSGIDYTVIDQQEYVNPPPPATKIEGEYAMSNMAAGGGVWQEMVTVRAWGDKCTHKSQILAVAIQVAYSRLFPPNVRKSMEFDNKQAARTGKAKATKFIKRASLSDHLHENYVEVRMETIASPLGYTLYGSWPIDTQSGGRSSVLNQLDYLLDAKGNSTDYSTVGNPDPGYYGSVGLQIAKVLFADACHEIVPKSNDSQKGCQVTRLKKELLPTPPVR